MINILLAIIAVLSSFSLPALGVFPNHYIDDISERNGLVETNLIDTTGQEFPAPISELKKMFQQKAPTLSLAVINKVLATLNCASIYKISHNNILTVIDYSLPSSKKRLWVFDLKSKKLLFHTFVSHGIRSGTTFPIYFSNLNNSKATSLGVYRTEKAYYGREGLSLRLEGLEHSFNGNAFNRYIVMHGGWYMDEQFIKKYGRAGRSWGCPSVPLDQYKGIINTIKENALFIVYYPSDDWLARSRFLNCNKNFPTQKLKFLLSEAKPVIQEQEHRATILFADLKKNNMREESDPIVVMSAENYENTFHKKVPLGRMLRRQINHEEYIALSNTEFNQLAVNNKEDLNRVSFVKPEIIMVHGGYYETQMKIVNLGTIKEVRFNAEQSPQIKQPGSYTVYLNNNSVIHLESSNRFIRWLGL